MSNVLPTIPDGWRHSHLEDLMFLDREKLGQGTNGSFSFYYIDISAVSEGNLRLPATKISFRGSPSRARKVVRRGDVLMASVRPNLKAFAYFDHTNDDCVASTGFGVLTAKPDVDPRFILASILSDSVTAQIESHVVGSNYPAINSKDIRRLEILAPPPAQQRKIARILTTADNLIEKTEALIAKYQSIKQGMMADLFTRGVDANGKLRPPQSAAPELYKQSELGWIPKEWEVQPLKEVADLQVGYAFKSSWFQDDGLFRLLRGENVGYGNPEWAETKFLSAWMAEHWPEYILHPRDFVIGMDRTFTKSGVKITEISENDCPCLLVQRVGRFIARHCENEFLAAFLKYDRYHSDLALQEKGMDIPHLSQSEILQPLIPLPKRDEQFHIACRVKSFDSTIESEVHHNSKLKSLKTGLMQDLLTGKVPVKPDEPEEAA